MLGIQLRRRRSLRDDTLAVLVETDEDLPCPWCGAATRETDPRCPGCGHRFG